MAEDTGAGASAAKKPTTTRITKASSVKKVRVSAPTKTTATASANDNAVEHLPNSQNSREKEQKAFGIFRTKKQPKIQTIEGALESITQQLIQERRNGRRWGIFFKLATFAFLFSVLSLIGNFGQEDSRSISDGEFTAVVEVQGLIASGEFASSDTVIGHLQAAFEHKGTQGIIIDIDSPGGSPVQSGQIYDEILRLQTIYPKTPVYAVISDIGASGAYYIAAAANEIYADKSSLVGSIGVIFGGFGFTGMMDKLGVERRLIVAGDNKAFLDPFSKEDPKLNAFWQGVLDQTHQQFIESVLKVRGDKITDDGQVFSGLIYNGERALELGLIDKIGDKRYVAREIIGHENLRYFTDIDKDWEKWSKYLGVNLGAALGQAFTKVASHPALR